MDDPRRGRLQRNDGGNGRKRQDSFFSDDSDGSPDEQSVRGFDSGSDSDPKKWTKNPLVVRRVKRSDKGKQTEKRLSASENGVATKNRNSFGYPGNEEGSSGTGSLGRGTSGSKDAGSASRGSSKFQRLEEMRKRRINLCVTSDEEATPSFGKTRLRQKVFQDRPVSTYHVSPPRWEAGAEQSQARSIISSALCNRHFPPSSPEVIPHHQTFSATPSFPPKTVLSNQAPSVSSQSYNVASGNQKSPQQTAGYSSNSSFPRNIAKTSSSLPRSDSIQPYWMSQNLQSSAHTSPATQQSPLRHQQLSTTTYTQPHKTDRGSDPGASVLNSSFHEVMVHRLTTQAEPSISLTTKPSARNTNQPQQVSHSQALNQARWNPTSKQDPNRPVSIVSSKSYPQNELDIRLKKPQPKVALGKPALLRQSDDSLDELIESNIQYLNTELEKSKPKKFSNTNIIKLSDSKKKFSAPPIQDQPSIQVAASTSIEFRVSLPSELRLPEKQLGVPVLQISASNPSFSFDKQIINQPDVVPRQYNREKFDRLSRPNSEYSNKDDVSKSPSMVTSQLVLHGHYGNTGQANNAREETGLVAFKPNTGNSLRAPQIDKGMFSDVEYDIEVSERVKKWETFMKDKDNHLPNERNQLTTIQESVKDDASDARKAVVLNKSWMSGPSYQSNNSEPASNRSKLFSSDIPAQRYDKGTAQPVFSVDTNVQKFFHTIQNPRVSLKPQNVNTLFHTPVSIERPLTIARDHALTNKSATPLQITAGPNHAVLEPTSAHVTGKQVVPLSLSSSDTSSFSKTEAKDAAKRESRYRDELAEISQVKSDSVLSLRRRFDTDSATMTSEDDMVSVSTASAKLSRPSKKSPQNKDSTDWSKVLPGYQTMIKDSDVWSPNLESTQGVPVSIERVTARTLQTIPFSEDPFWKELEQMTTFDPSSLAGHLNLNRLPEKSMIAEPIRSQHQVELSSPHSSTLPSQPRSNVMSFKERMQRSKSLYTPNIIPLTINVGDREPSSAAIALDEVLNDINKSSMERKQLSPKKRAVENDSGLSNLRVANTSGYLKPKFDKSNTESKFEGSKLSFGKIGTEKNLYPAKLAETIDTVYRGPGMATDQPKQPLQFYQNERQQQSQTQNRQSLALPSNVNNYQLDPNLLKEKLLRTGLVIETDTEEPANNQQKPSSFLSSSTQQPVAYTTPGLSTNTADPRTFSKSAVSQISNPATSQISNFKTSQFSKPTSELSKPTTLQFSKPTTSELSKPTTLQFSKPTTSELSKPTTLQFSKPATSQVTIPTVSQIPNSTTSQISNPAVAAPMAGIILDSPAKRPGTRALDDIQKALAPFTSTSYQPDPETLYGSSKLQSFSQPNFDTTRGPQTTSTSWFYKPHLKDANQAKFKQNSGENSSSRLQQVNKSMDDLKHLARDVEQRINVIKQKLVAADENSLDSILCSLRKVTPEIQSQEAEPRSLEDFYTTKKSKLSDALSELDRICKNLELSADDLANFQDAKTTETLTPNYFIGGQQPKSVHLRPMQTRISSVFIPGLDKKKKDENESEFDIISRSFQAIVDEVNQTTDMLSRASERQKKEQTAPETHKQIFKTTVKPGCNEPANNSSTKHAASTTTESKSLGSEENKTEEIKSKGSLFKSKESWNKDERTISAASENLQSEESNHEDLLGPNTESTSVTGQVSQETEQLTLGATASSSTAQQQSRVRPVKDNKIIQEDRANRKEGTRNVSSSPTVSRRIFGEQELDQQRFQESAEKVSEKQTALKQQTENLEDGLGSKSKVPEHEEKSLSGPSVLGATSASTAGSKSMAEGTSTALKLSMNKSILSGSSSGSSSTLSHQSSSASTTSINLTPPVSESSQQKAFTASSKLDDSESSSSTGLKTKRRLGTGVAMMLDKFSSGEDIDSSKKPGGIDQLSGSTQGEEIIDDKNSNQAPLVEAGGEKPSPPPQLKNPVRSLTRKLSAESKGALGSPKERKVVDFETKFTRSRTTSPQPSSPVNKPPLSPFRKQTSDSEIMADGIKQPSSGGSIKHVSKIPRPIVPAATTDRQLTSKGKDNPAQVAAQVQTKTLKSSDSKPQIGSLRGRPHSFHELISCFETGQGRLQSSDKFRKCASAGEVSSEALADEVFDEPGHATIDNLKARECGIRNKVAKFENKS